MFVKRMKFVFLLILVCSIGYLVISDLTTPQLRIYYGQIESYKTIRWSFFGIPTGYEMVITFKNSGTILTFDKFTSDRIWVDKWGVSTGDIVRITYLESKIGGRTLIGIELLNWTG